MPVPDDTRPVVGASTLCSSPMVVVRCEGCELVFEVDALGVSAGDQLADCGECGSPVYVVEPSEEDSPGFLAGFGAGWDACAAFMASVVAGVQLDELTPDVAAVVEGEG